MGWAIKKSVSSGLSSLRNVFWRVTTSWNSRFSKLQSFRAKHRKNNNTLSCSVCKVNVLASNQEENKLPLSQHFGNGRCSQKQTSQFRTFYRFSFSRRKMSSLRSFLHESLAIFNLVLILHRQPPRKSRKMATLCSFKTTPQNLTTCWENIR